jgi:tRNA-modifying protein YgfZ
MAPRYCLLPDRGCIEVRGRDATPFLQAQLSRTVASLDAAEGPLAGWHDARGRVRALFRVMRLTDRWLLWTPRDTLEQTIARLRLFVLRAAVTVTASDEWRAAMLVDAADSWLSAHGFPVAAPRDAIAEHAGLRWVRLGTNVWQAVGSADAVATFEPHLERGGPGMADLAEIQLGIPAVGAGLADRFIAQMLNLDRLDALSFDKGCYPGQEVIARVHNLGAVKRRMRRYAAASAAPPSPGADVTTEDRHPVGEIVRSARADAGVEVLAVVELSAVGVPLFHGDSPLHERPLPYDVPST